MTNPDQETPETGEPERRTIVARVSPLALGTRDRRLRVRTPGVLTNTGQARVRGGAETATTIDRCISEVGLDELLFGFDSSIEVCARAIGSRCPGYSSSRHDVRAIRSHAHWRVDISISVFRGVKEPSAAPRNRKFSGLAIP